MQEFDEGNKEDAESMRSESNQQFGIGHETTSKQNGYSSKERKKNLMSYCRVNNLWIRAVDEHCPNCKKYVGDKIIHGPKPFFERIRSWLGF